MAYIAKIALPYGGKFIRKGARVPADYKRLADGIKRGWIEVTGDPAATPPVGTVTEEHAGAATEIVTSEIVGETEIIASEIVGDYVEPMIDDLEYLSPMAKKSLAEIEVISVGDLEGQGAETLVKLHGIGVKLAERLIAEFEKHSAATTEAAEYSNMPEEEHGGYETEAAGADAGAENDPT